MGDTDIDTDTDTEEEEDDMKKKDKNNQKVVLLRGLVNDFSVKCIDKITVEEITRDGKVKNIKKFKGKSFLLWLQSDGLANTRLKAIELATIMQKEKLIVLADNQKSNMFHGTFTYTINPIRTEKKLGPSLKDLLSLQKEDRKEVITHGWVSYKSPDGSWKPVVLLIRQFADMLYAFTSYESDSPFFTFKRIWMNASVQ